MISERNTGWSWTGGSVLQSSFLQGKGRAAERGGGCFIKKIWHGGVAASPVEACHEELQSV